MRKYGIMGTVTALTAGAALVIATAPTALADQPRDTTEREAWGTCSGQARWDLSLDREFGGIEFSFDVEGATQGERWRVRVQHNGTPIVKTLRFADLEGEWDVEQRVSDRSGSDRFKVRAVSDQGQVCRAALRI